MSLKRVVCTVLVALVLAVQFLSFDRRFHWGKCLLNRRGLCPGSKNAHLQSSSTPPSFLPSRFPIQVVSLGETDDKTILPIRSPILRDSEHFLPALPPPTLLPYVADEPGLSYPSAAAAFLGVPVVPMSFPAVSAVGEVPSLGSGVIPPSFTPQDVSDLNAAIRGKRIRDIQQKVPWTIRIADGSDKASFYVFPRSDVDLWMTEGHVVQSSSAAPSGPRTFRGQRLPPTAAMWLTATPGEGGLGHTIPMVPPFVGPRVLFRRPGPPPKLPPPSGIDEATVPVVRVAWLVTGLFRGRCLPLNQAYLADLLMPNGNMWSGPDPSRLRRGKVIPPFVFYAEKAAFHYEDSTIFYAASHPSAATAIRFALKSPIWTEQHGKYRSLLGGFEWYPQADAFRAAFSLRRAALRAFLASMGGSRPVFVREKAHPDSFFLDHGAMRHPDGWYIPENFYGMLVGDRLRRHYERAFGDSFDVVVRFRPDNFFREWLGVSPGIPLPRAAIERVRRSRGGEVNSTPTHTLESFTEEGRFEPSWEEERLEYPERPVCATTHPIYTPPDLQKRLMVPLVGEPAMSGIGTDNLFWTDSRRFTAAVTTLFYDWIRLAHKHHVNSSTTGDPRRCPHHRQCFDPEYLVNAACAETGVTQFTFAAVDYSQFKFDCPPPHHMWHSQRPPGLPGTPGYAQYRDEPPPHLNPSGLASTRESQ